MLCTTCRCKHTHVNIVSCYLVVWYTLLFILLNFIGNLLVWIVYHLVLFLLAATHLTVVLSPTHNVQIVFSLEHLWPSELSWFRDQLWLLLYVASYIYTISRPSLSLSHTHTHTYVCTHTHTHTHTRTYTYVQTYTHTHAHTLPKHFTHLVWECCGNRTYNIITHDCLCVAWWRKVDESTVNC